MSRAVQLTAALSAALAVAAPLRSAWAAEPVILTPAVTEGELNPASAERLETSLRAAIRKSELELVEVDADAGARASACAEQDDACRAEALAAHGVRYLLVPTLAIDDQDYQMALTLYGPNGRELARLDESCGLCGLAEAADVFADLGARMSRKIDLAAQASAIIITSDPPGAKVYVGDELLGTTPVELPLAAGSHPLQVELDGYISQRRKVEVVAGETNKLALTLQPIPVEAEPDRAKSKLLGGLGWTALGLGLGAAGGGVALILIDEQPITSDCSGANVDAAGNCRWRRATLEPGIGLAVGGAVLIGGSVALLLLARKRGKSKSKSDEQARWQPRLGGLALEF